MRPLLLTQQDSDALQSLGRASVQIVHDLKNQLNGLKLYATFLRKRMEKGERAPDELETINKLIAGLDRAAGDLSTLLQYGRPLELKKQPEIDVQLIMRTVAATFPPGDGKSAGVIIRETEAPPLTGDFDPKVLADALQAISTAAVKLRNEQENTPIKISLKRESIETENTAIIEWHGLRKIGHDPFRSFAGGDEIRMSLAAKIIQEHGGSAEHEEGILRVRLPISS